MKINKFMQIIYRIIYAQGLNKMLRSLNKVLLPILPKWIKLPPTGVLDIVSKDGKKIKLSLNQTCGLGSIIYWEGGYEVFEYTPIFIKLSRKIDSFFDIGANIGYYSLLAAMENSNMKITCFEPATGPHFYLSENVRVNNFTNIKIEDVALSDQEGEIEFHEIKNKKYKYLEHCLAGESNAGSLTTGRNFQINKVKTTTFDRYVKENNIDHIDLVKIDTEGTEHFILNNASSILGEMKPIIICETLFDQIEDELEVIFSSFGYEFYNHVPKGLVKVPTIIRKEYNGVNNCFFVHPSKKHLIEEFIVKI